ncbi:MAG: hypothetical protein IKG27_04900 [Bacilli bacterium]|nr:hypothetical protein [Bacilli bacterium]
MKSKGSHVKLKKGLRRRTIFFLVLMFMANAFAWFIYSNKIAATINAGVKSWKITFAQNGTTLVNNVVFNVSDIYPGMSNYTDTINIRNSGEMPANIIYELTSVKIFENTYTNDNYTSAQLESMLANNYPFTITFSVGNPTIGITDSTNFQMLIVWPYESGDDALDTYWGKASYDFKNTYPLENEIEIHVKITATQDIASQSSTAQAQSDTSQAQSDTSQAQNP